jgi:hypothetical protein
MMFPGRGPGRYAISNVFALLEQAKGGDGQALSRAFERRRRRLVVLILKRGTR